MLKPVKLKFFPDGILLLNIPFIFLISLLFIANTESLRGMAVLGTISDWHFYLRPPSGSGPFVETDALDFLLNFVLSFFFFVSALALMYSIYYFPIKYYLPRIKERINKYKM